MVRLLFLASVLALSGCGTTTTPTRPLNEHSPEYTDAAKRASLANVCHERGYISLEQMGVYRRDQLEGYFPQTRIRIDPLVMAKAVRSVAKYSISQSWWWEETGKLQELKLKCADILVTAQRLIQKPSSGTREVVAPQPNMPKTTQCLETFGVIRCTTF